MRLRAPGNPDKSIAEAQERIDARMFTLGSIGASLVALVVAGATLAR